MAISRSDISHLRRRLRVEILQASVIESEVISTEITHYVLSESPLRISPKDDFIPIEAPIPSKSGSTQGTLMTLIARLFSTF